MDSDAQVSRRIAARRKARGMTQAQLAAATGVSASLVTKIERGVRAVKPDVLAEVARALAVDMASLTGEPRSPRTRIDETIPAIRRALDCYDLPEDGPTRPLGDLRAQVELASAWRLASQYARLADALPPLLSELTRAVHTYSGRDRETAFGLLAMAYRAADAIAYKFGYTDLSARAIELIRWAANGSGDPVLAGMAAYVRAETFFANKHLTAGLRALDTAAAVTPTGGTRRSVAAYGALHMRAAVMAARAGLSEPASAHLREAATVAHQVPEDIYDGTAFGPFSVKIHHVAVAVELGDGPGGLRHAAGWQPPSSLPAERRSHHYIDLARAQLWTGRRAAALESLQTARTIAPQHTRQNPLVRSTITTLLSLDRSASGGVRTFAVWVGST